VARETKTVSGSPFTIDLSDVLLADENSLYAVEITVYTAAGEEPLKQVTGAPAAADEFQVSTPSSGTVTFHSSRSGHTVRATYVYQVASRENLKVLGANVPQYGSLLLPFCGAEATAKSTDAPTGFYFPRVLITGGGVSVAAGATDLPRFAYNFSAIKDDNDLLYQVM
jgi:hypothetical protein